MAKVYADLIMKGAKTIDQVPSKLQKEVKSILKERGYIITSKDDAK